MKPDGSSDPVLLGKGDGAGSVVLSYGKAPDLFVASVAVPALCDSCGILYLSLHPSGPLFVIL